MTTSIELLLAHVLGEEGAACGPCESFAAWWPGFRRVMTQWPSPFGMATVGGFEADRVGYAFAAGYQAAMRALFPDVPGDRVASLCVTEARGGHPRAIEAALRAEAEGFLLDGDKAWSTLAGDAGLFFVVASEGVDEDGRKRLRVARVSAGAEGVTVSAMPPTPFVPEIGHGQVSFRGVAVDEDDVLPGDGYADYVKPFRTVEDVFVHAALLGHLCGVALRHAWPLEVRARLAAMLTSLAPLATAAPSAPATHLALAGVIGSLRDFLAESDALWDAAPVEVAERWRRDTPLMQIAEKARVRRTELAWQALGTGDPGGAPSGST